MARLAPHRILAAGLGFTEGPLFKQDTSIAFVSLGMGNVHSIDPQGNVSLLAALGGGPNGLAEGADGTLYVAQNGGRAPTSRKTPGITGGVQAITTDGRVTWVTQDPISPNDLCFGPDGYLYVTDPTRAYVDGMHVSRDDGRLWRVDVATGDAELLATVPWFPNGIGFGLESDALYVASTFAGQILRFPLTEASLGQPEPFVALDSGAPDGFAFDSEGNLVIATIRLRTDQGSGELQVWSQDGKLIDKVTPGTSTLYTNVAINKDRRLIVTDSQAGAVLAFDDWPTSGLALHPFRN